MKTPREMLIGLTLLMLILSACGSDSSSDDNDPVNSDATPRRVGTLAPQPDATVLPECVTGDLESWYEVAGSLLTTFTTESRDAVALPREEVPLKINRLTELRDAIAEQPTPECVVQIHAEILIRMRGILVAFQRYGNGEISQEELRHQIDESTSQIETDVTALLDETAIVLEDQLRQERQNPTATP